MATGDFMNKLPTEVAIDFPLYQSLKGLYFIGQTPILSGQSGKSLASLHNPAYSEQLIFVNAITITNISDKSLFAEFYLRSKCHGTQSNEIACTNTSICPAPTAQGSIEYIEAPTHAPVKGTAIFSRIVSPQSTLVVDGGQIILGEKQSLCVYIGGFHSVSFSNIRFAFGWSEKPIGCKC